MSLDRYIIFNLSDHNMLGTSGHVRIVKVQPTLTKVLLELGCVYSAIIMSNYSRSIVQNKETTVPTIKNR